MGYYCVAQGTISSVLGETLMEKNIEQECIYMYDWVTLLYSRNWHDIVNLRKRKPLFESAETNSLTRHSVWTVDVTLWRSYPGNADTHPELLPFETQEKITFIIMYFRLRNVLNDFLTYFRKHNTPSKVCHCWECLKECAVEFPLWKRMCCGVPFMA